MILVTLITFKKFVKINSKILKLNYIISFNPTVLKLNFLNQLIIRYFIHAHLIKLLPFIASNLSVLKLY